MQESLCGAQLLAAATTLFGTLPPYLAPADRAAYQQFAERAQRGLSATDFADAWVVGSGLAIEQAVTHAVGEAAK